MNESHFRANGGAGPSQPKRPRTVPDSARQRARASCDRCKTRKVRCIRLPLASPSDPCAACAQLNHVCESTLPRKKRSYINAEVEPRYRAFEDLAARLFPESNLSTVEDIERLVKEKEREREGSFTTRLTAHGSRFIDSSRPIPEGRLIPSVHGVYHYVGPSSSYSFANTIRILVAKVAERHPNPFEWSSVPRHRAAKFSSHNRTSALDARIRGHPNTTVTDGASPTQRSSPGVTKVSLDMLPDRNTSDRLVDAFFARVHPNYTMFLHAAFRKRYETLWQQLDSGRYITQPSDVGWLCSLFLIYVLSAQAIDDGTLQTDEIQRKYLTGVLRERLAYLLVTSSLDNVRCLMLLALYQHNVGERNTAWIIIGQASRMAIALGMQRQSQNEPFDTFERTERQMVWWTMHLFEQNLCFVLGRPGSTDTIDVTANLPDEKFVDGSDTPPTWLEHAINLAGIAVKIKRFVACISPLYEEAIALLDEIAEAQQLLKSLDDWRAALPLHLKLDAHSAHRRPVMLLHLQVDHLSTAVGRPFLLALVASQANGRPEPLFDSAMPLVVSCLKGAYDVCSHLRTLEHNGLLEGKVWYDFFYAHHSALILSLASFHRLLPGSRPFMALETEEMYRSTVFEILDLSKRTKLGPTYRILMDVSMQFAKLVGILSGNDLTRPPSPRPEINTAPLPPLQSEILPPASSYDSTTYGEALEWNTWATNDGLESMAQPMMGLSLERLLGLETDVLLPLNSNVGDTSTGLDNFFLPSGPSWT